MVPGNLQYCAVRVHFRSIGTIGSRGGVKIAITKTYKKNYNGFRIILSFGSILSTINKRFGGV